MDFKAIILLQHILAQCGVAIIYSFLSQIYHKRSRENWKRTYSGESELKLMYCMNLRHLGHHCVSLTSQDLYFMPENKHCIHMTTVYSFFFFFFFKTKHFKHSSCPFTVHLSVFYIYTQLLFNTVHSLITTVSAQLLRSPIDWERTPEMETNGFWVLFISAGIAGSYWVIIGH